jgi:predicted nucleic acid-binding protein
MAIRHEILTIEDAISRLTMAGSLGIHAVPNRMLWQGAIMRAHQSGVAAYDTLFVELAARKRMPLATQPSTQLCSRHSRPLRHGLLR